VAVQSGAGGAAGGGNPRRARDAVDRASAAECGKHSDDPPERMDRLSGNEPASGRRSAD